MRSEEERNKRIGVLTSVGFHIVLFIISFFIVAWRAPNPPLPEYGIELNFGLDTEGSGEVQPTTPVGDENAVKDEVPQDQASESQPEEQPTEETEKVSENAADKPAEQAVSKVENPVTVKEEKKETKTPVVKDRPKESKPTEKIIAEYKKEDKKPATAAELAAKGTLGNQGDDAKKVGDKGSPEGKLDAKALYGTPGGGGGGNGMDLQMSGWAWADQPKIPELPDNENGKVVFEIECDETGEIIGIKTIERSLSLRAEQILKDEIRKNSLRRTSSGQVPERSKGKIEFILKTK
jgi:protein TonB